MRHALQVLPSKCVCVFARFSDLLSALESATQALTGFALASKGKKTLPLLAGAGDRHSLSAG